MAKAHFRFKPRQRQALADGSLRWLPETQREALIDATERWLGRWGRIVTLTPSTAKRTTKRKRLEQAAELAEKLAALCRHDHDVRVELMLQDLDLDRGFEVASAAGYARVDSIADNIEALAARLRRPAENFRTERGGQKAPETMLVLLLVQFWREHTGQSPSAGSRSRFMQFIDQLDTELRVAALSRSIVRRVLAKP